MSENCKRCDGSGREAEADALCNLCGLSCMLYDRGTPFELGGLIRKTVDGGYESTPGNGSGALDDMTGYTFSLCEFCLDWLFAQFVIPVALEDVDNPEYRETWRPAAERVATDDWRRMKTEFRVEAERRALARSAKNARVD